MSDRDVDSKLAEVTRGRFGVALTRAETLAQLKSLRVILAADGESPEEREAWFKFLRADGVPEEILAEAAAWDAEKADPTEVLSQIEKGSRAARQILWGSIALASADGYSEVERAMARKVAAMIGVSAEALDVLEAIVELDWKVSKLKHARLKAAMTEVKHAIFESE
jgi:tellurite resistance protein